MENPMKQPSRKSETLVRQAIIDKCRWMNAEGLNQGTSGNISVRHGNRLLITPTAIPYDAMRPEMIAAMPLDGDYGSWEGPLKPSSEWRFHMDIMLARPDVGAIVHTHSTFATIIAITRREIPACHYMVAAFGGSTIRCAPYARYGTKQLSTYAVEALADRLGCLLGSHGMIALGDTLDKAMWHAVELETLAKQYYHSLLIGGPVILTDEQIAETAAAMKGGYGEASVK
jgi:L-fuculose-phosphate aldolase